MTWYRYRYRYRYLRATMMTSLPLITFPFHLIDAWRENVIPTVYLVELTCGKYPVGFSANILKMKNN
jgi:hypothetical protein